MDKRVKALWLEALTSGEYEQGKGYLRIQGEEGKDSFCCLGVLCDLAEKEGITTSEPPAGTENSCGDVECDVCNSHKPYLYNSQSGALPRRVQEWSGVSGNGNLTKEVEGVNSLVLLNDDAGYDFNQIAEVIREQF